ncbi:hypothetical protein CsatB_008105 [Cannabis sativa]|uniref:bZIP transcription factor 27 n=1 Tax=Cannabis sativa TaxID=3483 RepID=UPI0011DFC680|nr:bZIP transcription factor 27 [Cannabis sativa]
MEDIWKDINLTSLPESNNITVNSTQPQQIIITAATNYVPSMAFPFCNSHSSTPPTPTTMFYNSSSYGNKSLLPADNGYLPADDKHMKRMIKNRESACRSRARKEAYRTNLENEAAKLSEENRKLRKKQEEIEKEIAAEQKQLSKKRTLHRTSTAPF